MQTEESDADVIVRRVDAARDAFERIAAPGPRSSENTSNQPHEDAAATELQDIIDSLQHHVVAFARKPPFTASRGSVSLMEAGVVLYNASRKALKAMMATNESANEVERKSSDQHSKQQQPSDFVLRYWVIAARFWACKIMSVSLWQSKSSGAPEQGESKNHSRYLNECIDVLRSFGRVGTLLLERQFRFLVKRAV